MGGSKVIFTHELFKRTDFSNILLKTQNFFRTQDNRQLLRLFGRWNNFFKVPILMERYFVEETKSRYGDDDRARSELPFVH
jgi:hypothetical protein